MTKLTLTCVTKLTLCRYHCIQAFKSNMVQKINGKWHTDKALLRIYKFINFDKYIVFIYIDSWPMRPFLESWNAENLTFDPSNTIASRP